MQRIKSHAFDFQSRHIEYALDRTPKSLAASLVRLALSGAEGDLWPSLRKMSDHAAEIMSEVVVFYLYAADRIADEFFALIGAEAATRDLFFTEVTTEARELLREIVDQDGGQDDLAGILAKNLEERRSEYARCREMFRTQGQSLEGSVLFSFYKHLLGFGREPSILVMSQIELERVETQVEEAFAEVADRLAMAPEELETPTIHQALQ